MTQYLFSSVTLLDPRQPELLPDHYVLVEGEHIKDVSGHPIAAPGARVIDGRGKTLMPGLIDCHVHVLAAGLNLWQNANLPNSMAAFKSIPILRGMLTRGFTTVRDAAGADWSIAEAVRTGLVAGPRIFPSGKALSPTGGHGDLRPRNDIIAPCGCESKVGSLTRIIDGLDACRTAVREEVQKGATQIKVMASGGVASPNDPIHFMGFSEAELTAICEQARDLDTYVLAHAYTPAAIARAVRCGVRTIEHGNLVDAPTAAAMAKAGAYAVPTLVTYDALARDGKALGFPAESIEKIESVRNLGRESLAIFRAAGVKMAFGSDLLGDCHRYQSDEFTIRAEVLGAYAVIQSATLIGAEVLRMTGKLGEIVPGAFADMLLVDGNPYRDITCLTGQGERIAVIMQAGELVKHAL